MANKKSNVEIMIKFTTEGLLKLCKRIFGKILLLERLVIGSERKIDELERSLQLARFEIRDCMTEIRTSISDIGLLEAQITQTNKELELLKQLIEQFIKKG